MNPPGEDHDPRNVNEDHDPGPPPIQFRLKTLLVVTTLAGLLCAVLSRVGGVWVAIVVWISMLIGGHVLGNAMGTRAAAHVSGRRRLEPLTPAVPVDPSRVAAPSTTLSHNAALGMHIFLLVGCGAVVGSLVGTVLVWIHNDRRLNASALVLAAFSSAIVGAFLTFLSTSCFQVVARAVRAAQRHSLKK